MGRPLPRVLNPLALLALLLLAPAGAEPIGSDPDPTGDVTQGPGVPVDDATVDLVDFTADLEGDVLVLRNEVAAPLPLVDVAEANESSLYTFLFVVDFDSDMGPLVQSTDLAVVCRFHPGVADLACEVTRGEFVLRGIGTSDRNVTVRVAIPPETKVQPAKVGGAVTVTDEATGNITAQDWTPATIGGQDPSSPGGPEGPETHDDPDPGQDPWYKRPVGLVLVSVAVLGLSFLAYRRWRNRPGD